MIQLARRSGFERQPSLNKIRLVPATSVMLGSVMTVLPFIATVPLMPPFGLMMFLGWRLLQREIWNPWAGAMFGLFDDMWSGQPPGSGMLLWSLAQLLIAAVDQRIMWRDYWIDWALAALLIAFVLCGDLAIANITGGHTHLIYIIPQILITILCQPFMMRIVGALDRWRFA